LNFNCVSDFKTAQKLNRNIAYKEPNRQQQLHKMQGFSGIIVSHHNPAKPKVERLRSLAPRVDAERYASL
jgi:hypothetical protein